MFAVAEALGRPVFEVEATHSFDDLIEWGAYWQLKAEAEKKAADEARRR